MFITVIITLVVGIDGCGLTVARRQGGGGGGGGRGFVEAVHCADVSRSSGGGGKDIGGGYQGYVVHLIDAEQVSTALHKL